MRSPSLSTVGSPKTTSPVRADGMVYSLNKACLDTVYTRTITPNFSSTLYIPSYHSLMKEYASLIPRLPHSGMQVLQSRREGEPGIFSHVSGIKSGNGM